ncbi:MAG: hypothetical protein OEW67_07020 [Cyclobacteriaceae bacterium]|nr:hypothetical protein [Cyclobacteriaceae bacterium]
MLYILFSILANVGIFICFKMFTRFRINTFQAIVINYFVCVITGVVFIGDTQLLTKIDFSATWVILAIALGTIFTGTFNLMAITTQKLGITVASVASKMSLIIPVVMSIFVFNIQSKEHTALNYFGILLAMGAIVLSSIKKRRADNNANALSSNIMIFLLPFGVFVLGGIIDTSINFINYKYITYEQEAIFPIITFFSAFLVGALTLAIKRKKIDLQSAIGGTVLGAINYFSFYFLVKGLTSFNNDGALVYPMLSIGIILFSTFFSILLFKEKLLRVNKIGLLLAILSVTLIFYQEIMEYYTH